MGARAACTVRCTRKEREITGAEGCGSEVKSERTLAVECMTVAVSIGQMIDKGVPEAPRTRKA